MGKYYATVEIIRSLGVEIEAGSDNHAIAEARKYADSLTDEEFVWGGYAKDWCLVDQVTNRTVVPFDGADLSIGCVITERPERP